MDADCEKWQIFADMIESHLIEIEENRILADIPLSRRSQRAIDILLATAIEVTETDMETFMMSSAYGRILIIVQEWYRNRYGADAVKADESYIEGIAIIHDIPYLLCVPRVFSAPGKEPGTRWIASTDSVQDEEKPLLWIKGGPNLDTLPEHEIDALKNAVTLTSNHLRSIRLDVISLKGCGQKDIEEMSASVIANIESAGRSLCSSRNNAGRRDAGWSLSQAVEKSLKVYILRNGAIPPHIHNLTRLASKAESVGSIEIDRDLLSRVLSDKSATGIRYGGYYTLTEANSAYDAALKLIQGIMFESKAESKYNTRKARFLLQRPPWFNFDTDGFLRNISARDKLKN